MCAVIETRHLSRNYKNLEAVKDVSLTINKGEIYGFIGLNGAGKTTTIRMLLGMIQPTRGACFIKGERVSSTNYRIWKDVGYIVETPHAYPELTVEENLRLFQRLRLLEDPSAVAKVMTQLQLTRYAQVKAGNLSMGNARRLGIAKALLHAPEILILDEPVNGLDPAGIVEIRKLLQELAFDQGVTILMSSHLLSEVAKIATKIGIIHEGQLLQEVETKKLDALLHRQLMVNTKDNQVAVSKLMDASYRAVECEHGLIKILDDRAVKHPEAIANLLVNEGLSLTQLTVEEESLEAYFLRVIQGEGVTLP